MKIYLLTQWEHTFPAPSAPPPAILRVVPICVFVPQSVPVPVSRKVIKLIACFTTQQQQQLRAEKITPNFRLKKKMFGSQKLGIIL